MGILSSRLGNRWLSVVCVAVVALLVTSRALASDAERKAVIAKVNPSVVQVRLAKSLGSGFVVVVNGDEAIAATNYHVIEGADKATIFFPATDRDMKEPLEADGYIEIEPERDLALVHFKLKGKKVEALKIAEALPEQGDTIYTFGSPVGQKNTVAVGMVSSVRTGQEVSDLMERSYGKGAYEKGMSYTKEATWIQHTAPMSHGNSGGPLVNEKGEVVGLNTMNFAQEGTSQGGQNLNYSISAIHLKALLTKSASKTARAWKTLPAPREHPPTGGGPPGIGDPVATMKNWKLLNRAKVTLESKVAEADAKLEKIPAYNPRYPISAQNARNKKVAKVYREIAKYYSEYAAAVKAAKSENADMHLIKMIVSEGNLGEKLSGIYKQAADRVQEGSPDAEGVVDAVKQHLVDSRSEHDVLRINLSRIYGDTYPTLDDTKREMEAAADEDGSKKGDGGDDKDKPVDPRLTVLRTWTDASGKHKIKAHYRGMEDGKVKLEKTDGTVIQVDPESLSEKDRRFLGVD